ncbi:MAG TPA: OmpA family protein [Crocinitomix sp.]|nr:OmpA family protein [Crocinitomix sp.]
MKKIALSILAITALLSSNAQDYNDMLENGGFEQVEGKIKKGGQIHLAVNWMSPTKTGADLFSTKVKQGYGTTNPMGKEDPYEGDCYAGIKVFSYGDKEARTYISAKLKTPLRSGLKYCVKYYVSLAEGSKYASNNIAATFSKKQYNIAEDKSIMAESDILKVGNPVLNAMYGWDEICGIYTAKGGEKFITIGNFSSNADTKSERLKKPKGFTGQQMISAYYYIDNISVVLIEEDEDCDCAKPQNVNDEVSIVYSVSPVNPEGMKDEQIVKYSVVYFAKNKSNIEEGADLHLENIAKVMLKNSEYKLKLFVHLSSDEMENAAELEKARVTAIKKYFMDKGIDGRRVTAEFFKDTKPKDTSGSDLGNAKNRRVNFMLVK